MYFIWILCDRVTQRSTQLGYGRKMVQDFIFKQKNMAGSCIQPPFMLISL